MRKTLLALTLLASASLCPAADFPGYGFSIDTLNAPLNSEGMQAVIMFLPPKDGFSPNVNVMIQSHTGSMAEYAKLSKEQMTEMNWTFLSDTMPTPNEWVFEYTGQLQDKAMHWYARAILKDGRVYLVTSAAPPEQWQDASAALKKCVDSFKLTPAAQ